MKAFANPKSSKDRRFYAEAQQMFNESKKKIDALQMQILKASKRIGEDNEAAAAPKQSPLEIRIVMLNHYIEIESRVVDGIKNVIKTIRSRDKKSANKKDVIEVMKLVLDLKKL